MDIKVLREEFAKLHTDANAVLETAAKEKRDVTAEEKAANTARFARMDAIQAQVDEAKRLATYSVMNGEAQLPTQPAGAAAAQAERTGKFEFSADSYKAAVNLFARTGSTSQIEQFAITSGTQSGVYLPKDVEAPVQVRRLPNAIRAVLAQYGVTPITRTLTESISLPVQDDSAVVGQAQNEAATSGTAADPSHTGSLTLNPTLYSSKQQWLSNTTVGAVDFDLFSYMLPMLYKRLDKIQESTWITNLMTNGTTGTTTASKSTFTYAEWMAFEASLPAAYSNDSAFIMSQSSYQIVRSLVDNNKRPIFDLDPTNQFMSRIHGRPVIISDYVQTMGTAANCVAAYVSAGALMVFDAGMKRVARYILQPAYPDQTGFELFANGDFGFVSAGVRTLDLGTGA